MPLNCPQCGAAIGEENLQLSCEQIPCPQCQSPIVLSSLPTFDVGATAAPGEREGALAGDKTYALEVLDGNEPGKVFPIEKTHVIIGRRDSDIVLDDPEISRKHLMISIQGPEAKLEDLDSTNGTYVEGIRVKQGDLKNGSVFRLGTHQLVFHIKARGA